MKYLSLCIILLLSACRPTTDTSAARETQSVDGDHRNHRATTHSADEPPGATCRRGVLPKESTVNDSRKMQLSPGPVSNFDDGSLKIPDGFGWAPSTDSMMGGSSTVDLLIEQDRDSGRYLRVRGTIGAADFPWAGAIFFPGERPMEPVDATAVTTLRFSARGSGILRVFVFAESLGWIPAERSERLDPRWKECAIPFSTFEDVDRTGIKAVLFSGGPEPGDFRFDIDEVEFR